MSAEEKAAAVSAAAKEEATAVSAATRERATAVSGAADGTRVTVAREGHAAAVSSEEKTATAAA